MKTATRKLRHQPRRPSRGNGVARYNSLVDAAERLLEAHDPDDVGLYQIAEEADAPPASVYHFFPTKEAAFTAVAMRIAEDLMVVYRQPAPAKQARTWESLLRSDAGRARDFYNARPAALKIIYGGFGGVDARAVDQETATRMAAAEYERLNKIYHMPFIRNQDQKFENRIAILDSLWALSVQKTGLITDYFFQESLAAAISYTRTFLPEFLEHRDILLNALKNDESVILPFDL